MSTKRSVMTLFNNETDARCHRVRIVLAEKGVAAEFVNVTANSKPEELFELNPYGYLPTLIDRDLVLYYSGIISEYLEERFPHPPLMPVYPVARSRNRLMMARIDEDWYALMDTVLKNEDKAKVKKARTDLLDSLVAVAPVFSESPFFLNEEFSLVDCSLAALLWRLPVLGIQLPPQAKSIEDYCKRVFNRESFKQSLSDAEREMREED